MCDPFPRCVQHRARDPFPHCAQRLAFFLRERRRLLSSPWQRLSSCASPLPLASSLPSRSLLARNELGDQPAAVRHLLDRSHAPLPRSHASKPSRPLLPWMRSRRASAPPLILPPLSPNPNSIYGIVLKAQHSEGHTNDHVLLLFSYNVLLEAISRAGGGRFRVERTNLTPTDLDEEVVSSPFHSFHVSDFCVFLCPHAIERCTRRSFRSSQALFPLFF
jgi:hypothetical protein